MYLWVQREGDSAPAKYDYNPKKFMSPECEALEKKTGLTFEEFHAKLIQGSALCRRALLWVYLKREAAGVRFEDVAFAYGEVELRFHKQELEDMIAEVEKADETPERNAGLAQLREMLADSEDSPEVGKAP